MSEFYTRMGDGKRVTMTKEQIMNDLQAGTDDAADMGGMPVPFPDYTNGKWISRKTDNNSRWSLDEIVE